MSTAKARRSTRRREQGLALVLTLFATAALLMVAAAGMNIGTASVHATRNYRGATRAHMAAEAGISEALQVINGPGVINLQNDVVTPWAGIYGSGDKIFGPHSRFTYYVTPFASAADPVNSGRLVARARGPEGEFNAVVATVIRSDTPSTAPGAIYLASDAPTNATFQGNAFHVDGNDHNYTGGYGPSPPVPGISTRNDSNTQEAISSLGAGQRDNVTGLGFSAGPPVVTSISTSPAAPSAAQLSQMIDDLLADPMLVEYTQKELSGNMVFGTEAAPQISYLSDADGVKVKGNGNISGAGILIVESDLTIQGSMEFKGLILVRGKTSVEADTDVTGNATVYGSLWTGDLNLNVGGSAIVYYSTQALALADQVVPGGALPAPLRVTQLADCAMVASGVGGCP
jgi:hypothetical protein